MKLNENTAVATDKILLVPYDRRHVPTYHGWMEDEAVRAATASDRLTLEEEYENQVSWRQDADKLTFIVCRGLGEGEDSQSDKDKVLAGRDDRPQQMVGDINFFVHENDEDEDETGSDSHSHSNSKHNGEIDVMIANPSDRGHGLGRAAVTAFLHYILTHLDAIMAEYLGSTTANHQQSQQLSHLVVKIQQSNAASIGLFTSLGFVQKGDVNYFGEVELVHRDVVGLAAKPPPQGYREEVYVRSDL